MNFVSVKLDFGPRICLPPYFIRCPIHVALFFLLLLFSDVIVSAIDGRGRRRRIDRTSRGCSHSNGSPCHFEFRFESSGLAVLAPFAFRIALVFLYFA
jgi:hypothetical protein